MAEVVDALRVTLPASLGRERFADPARREELAAAIATLARSAEALEAHGRGQEAGFAYLSQALARDAEEIERRFAEQRVEEARFLLGELANECITCHSRLPGRGDSDLGRTLFEDVSVASLAPSERVRLEVATRQFDRALATWEEIFRAGAPSATELDLEGALTEYLVVAVRVADDLPRARRTLDAFAQRTDVPEALRAELAGWSGELAALAATPPPERDLLERARRAIDEGAELRRFPADRAGLVHDLVASSWLQRLVAAEPEPSPRTAEAYALLGAVELRDQHSTWLSQAEFYLETAIRMAPGSETAKGAYALLEEETRAGWSGSGGEHLPPDVGRWLDDLHALAFAENAG
jgi:hypothetical protein